MSDRKITHEVKLQKSVIIILAVLAVGVMANAFAPAFNVKDALAQVTQGGSYYFPIHIKCDGCN
tara:strand:+ start:1029 stop:1220 length:192 start_codon:yes stop_codon:yes gene_type:complete